MNRIGLFAGAAVRTAAGLALLTMVFVTLADVVGRRLLGSSVAGVVEIVELALVWMIFPGIAITFAAGGHIVVDVLERVLSPTGARILDLFARALSLAVLGLLCWLTWGELLDKLDWGEATVSLRIPLTWYWAAPLVGFALSLAYLIEGALRGAQPQAQRPPE